MSISPLSTKISLPKVVAPSLEGLAVEVASPVPPGQDELIAELYRRLRQVAKKRERNENEPVEQGDEVELDLVTVVNGQVLVSGVQRFANFELREWVHLPGLMNQLIGMPTWSAKTVDYQFPANYPVPTLANQLATIFVSLRYAQQVEPFELDDPELLSAAGLSSNIDEAFSEIAEQIDQEQGQELLTLSTQAVLHALGQRVSEPIPSELIDLELDQSWQKSIGQILHDNQFEANVLKASYRQFLNNDSLRLEASHRLRTNLALRAIVDKEQLKEDPELRSSLVATTLGALEQGEATESTLLEDVEYQAQLQETSLYLTAVQFVMARAKVTVLED